MSSLIYHLESENLNQKNYLVVSLGAVKPILSQETLFSYAVTSADKAALEFLVKEHKRLSTKIPLQNRFDRLFVPSDQSFDALKLLGATGKLVYQNKKVVVDPFTSLDFYFEVDRQDKDLAVVKGCWKQGSQSKDLQACDFIFSSDPSWVLYNGIIRQINDEIAGKWVRLVEKGPKSFARAELIDFLDRVEGEVPLTWKNQDPVLAADPMPYLILVDRHGGFANLGFDYGHHGQIAFHDIAAPPWRKKDAEKSWEKDLLETDFLFKIVDRSHYYCPLDKVAKSLTFLLEIGWTVLDCHGRKVLRQKQVDFDAHLSKEKITIQAKIHYNEHQVDLKDLVGAFNRRDHFVELSPQSVALIDRDDFASQWGDFSEAEITSDGISLKKNRFGLLLPLIDEQRLPIREDLKSQIQKLARCEPASPIEPSEDFKGTLFAYQKEGLQWLKFLQEGEFGGLLADEMGLGKTVQVLAFFSQCELSRPILIVVPTSLLFNWQREVQKFLPMLAVYRHEGKERHRTKEALGNHSIILTSYALLRLDAELFQEIDYQVVILDEAQAIKNPESQIANVCLRMKAQMRLAITGTPIENRLEDLWSIFRFLIPDLLGERRQFQSEMLAAQSDSRYLERVKKKIRPFLLRRKKDQVALQLPAKIEQTIFIEMTDSQREVYERWLQNTKHGLLKKISLDGASSHRMEILEAILRLRQLCVHPWLVQEHQDENPIHLSAKFERLLSDLQEVVEEGSKVLVYSQFTQMLQLIEQEVEARGWKYVYLDGSSKDREKTVQQFQEDPETLIFLISLKAGGVGLNLTAADYVFLYDPWWNDSVERQAIDRAHRLGKVGTVIARRYITALSIEEKILRLKEHKTSLSQNLLDLESGPEAVSLDDLLDLLH
jgi:superfamily II DNA or RNA helicase